MERFFDMHCHILPETDDGAKDLAETRLMLRKAYDEGIRYIIATPHCHPRRGGAAPDVLRSRLRLVREEAAQISSEMKIWLGTEIYFGQDIPELLAEKRVLTMNGSRYVLVEFSPSDPYDHICQGIQQLQMKGYEVILAHIERYHCMYDDMADAEHLTDMGVRIQVNAGSITGQSGWKAKRFVKKLLERELVFCVGTDAHDAKKRPPQMRKAAAYVAKKYGKDYARRIFFSNPRVMLRKKTKNEPGKNHA